MYNCVVAVCLHHVTPLIGPEGWVVLGYCAVCPRKPKQRHVSFKNRSREGALISLLPSLKDGSSSLLALHLISENWGVDFKPLEVLLLLSPKPLHSLPKPKS